MSKHIRPSRSRPACEGPALGEVRVLTFEATIDDVRRGLSLDDQEIVAVIKPQLDPPFWKCPGGMLRQGETFEEAVVYELEEETGAKADIDQLHLLYEEEKERRRPHSGTFPVKLFAAFGCDYDSLLDPLSFEEGDEGELVSLIRLGDINEENTWPIPNIPSSSERFYGPHLRLLSRAMGHLSR